MKIKPEPRPDFATRKFVVTMTGHELAHLWWLSYSKEGGSEFPTTGRFTDRIEGELGHQDLFDLRKYASPGAFVPRGPVA